MWAERGVQAVEHHAWLHTRPSLLEVDLQDAIHVPGEVEHQGASDGLPGEAGAGAAGQERDALARGEGDGRGHILLVAGHHHPKGLFAVDAGIGAVERPGKAVEVDFSLQALLQFLGYGCHGALFPCPIIPQPEAPGKEQVGTVECVERGQVCLSRPPACTGSQGEALARGEERQGRRLP